MIITKKCRIKNWDESNISPLQMIRDRILIDQNNINFVVDQLNSKKINKRFHDEPKRIINTLIRTCHGSLGMYASTNTGCLYYEDGTFKKETTVEHTVPVSKLIDLNIPCEFQRQLRPFRRSHGSCRLRPPAFDR